MLSRLASDSQLRTLPYLGRGVCVLAKAIAEKDRGGLAATPMSVSKIQPDLLKAIVDGGSVPLAIVVETVSIRLVAFGL